MDVEFEVTGDTAVELVAKAAARLDGFAGELPHHLVDLEVWRYYPGGVRRQGSPPPST